MTNLDEELRNSQEYVNTTGELNRPFETPEHISKHLLDVNTYTSNAVNHDSARANLNANELRQARSDGSLLIELEEAEKLCGWDLQTQKDKTFGTLGVLNVTSRSKNGWASVLAKTDKHVNIQTTEQLAEDINTQFNEETSKGLLSKIPFLKRKEM